MLTCRPGEVFVNVNAKMFEKSSFGQIDQGLPTASPGLAYFQQFLGCCELFGTLRIILF